MLTGMVCTEEAFGQWPDIGKIVKQKDFWAATILMNNFIKI